MSEAVRDEALRFYDRGVPAMLSQHNPYKDAVMFHWWGYHRDTPRKGCPICERMEARND